MSEVRAVALSLLALLGAIVIVAPASLAVPAQSPAGTTGPQAATSVGHQTANNTSMGGQVSSFMHSSGGQASEAVESGMWNAAYANASNKSAVVDSRAADIESRLADLETDKQQLIEARQDGEITRAEYRARMSAIVGRLAELNRSIDETERQARESGANVTHVEQLRNEASNMTGPEVAAVATSFAGGPPEGAPGGPAASGPPDHAGPPNSSDDRGNSDQGPPGNESGAGEGAGGGPDDDSGGGSDKGNGGGSDGG